MLTFRKTAIAKPATACQHVDPYFSAGDGDLWRPTTKRAFPRNSYNLLDSVSKEEEVISPRAAAAAAARRSLSSNVQARITRLSSKYYRASRSIEAICRQVYWRRSASGLPRSVADEDEAMQSARKNEAALGSRIGSQPVGPGCFINAYILYCRNYFTFY